MSNPEQFLTTAAGATIGFFVGGGIPGALAGARYGLLAGSLLFPADLPAVQGPRLEDFEQVSADPGSPIAIVFGTAAVPGFRMYLGPVTEVTSTEEVGGKGAPEQEVTTFHYYQTIALGLCEGPIAGIRRIWENGELVYDKRPKLEGETDDEYQARLDANELYESTFTLYLGTEDQLPDPTLEAEQGEGNVPAFRGLAYIVFPNRELKSEQGNRHPIFKIEVSATLVESSVLVAVGDPGGFSRKGIVRSLDGGVTWETADIEASTKAWQAVAYSPKHRRFVAVRAGFAALSDDQGKTWTEVALPSAQQPADIYWSELTELFLTHAGVFPNSTMMWSEDGEEWGTGSITSGFGIQPPVYFVDAAHLGRVYCSDPAGWIRRSADGKAWEPVVNVTGISRDMDYSPDLGLLIATGELRAYTSPDGSTWTLRTTLDSSGSIRSAWSSDLKLWAIINNGDIRTSTDGVDWEDQGAPPVTLGAPRILWSSKWERFVAVGAAGRGVWSEDGESWTEIPGLIDFGILWQGLAEGGYYPEEILPVPLSDVVAAICQRAGLDESQFDATTLEDASVLGYVIARETSARAALEPLRMVGLFDIVERDEQILFPVRGGEAVATLTEDDLGPFYEGEAPPPAVTTTKTQDFELPRQIRFRYQSLARDYETGEQLSPVRHGTIGVNDVTVDCPVVLTDDDAAQLAEIHFREAWAGRWQHTFVLDASWHALEPSDALLIPVDGRLQRVRIVTIDDQGLLLRRVTAVRDDPGSYVSIAIASPPLRPDPVLSLLGSTDVALLDLPALREEDDDAGIYVAGRRSGVGQAWPGAWVHRSIDDGVTFQPVLALGAQAVIGEVVSAPASGNVYSWDNREAYVIDILSGLLQSRTDAAVLAGANTAAVGAHGRWHIFQFARAELVSTGRYRLTRLLLGRRGTEHLVGTVQPGDTFVLVSGAGIYRLLLQSAEIGQSRIYRPVTNGSPFESGTDQTFTAGGQALETFAPVRIRGTRDLSGDLTISWIRRDRLSPTLRDGVPVPMSETTEAYEVDILDGSNVVRTLTSSTTSAVYTAAQQTEDFGSPPSSVTVRVYQMSSVVGRGTPAEATI